MTHSHLLSLLTLSPRRAQFAPRRFPAVLPSEFLHTRAPRGTCTAEEKRRAAARMLIKRALNNRASASVPRVLMAPLLHGETSSGFFFLLCRSFVLSLRSFSWRSRVSLLQHDDLSGDTGHITRVLWISCSVWQP